MMKRDLVMVLLVLGVALRGESVSPLQESLEKTGLREEAPPTPTPPSGSTRFRLPDNLHPTHYRVHLRPILSATPTGSDVAFTAPGTVAITLNVTANTPLVVLHAFQLHSIDLGSIQVVQAGTPERPIEVMGVSFHEEEESMRLSLAEELLGGETYVVSMAFVAWIALPTERMNGLYRSFYRTEDGQERWIATTHFSRARAFRKLLPSFDEPAQKAVFEISIGRLAEHQALSNMGIRETVPNPDLEGWFWDHFHPTPVMPPTVIAIVVSDFSAQAAPEGLYAKPVFVWGPPAVVDAGDAAFAAEAVARTLTEYDAYFDIPYELPKMDSVGLNDFQAGAMENWGLNLYRSVYMFWNTSNTAAAKHGIANVISHELAHQWWGNLVTHAWWNDWWLTEGFATYFQYFLFARAYPNFDPSNRIISDEVQPAMAFDITAASVPVHGSVTDEFVENPSAINYSKGASLVRMMRSFLSEPVFATACKHYLRKRSYTAVEQDALFGDLQESVVAQGQAPSNGRTMAEIMNTWTLQTGFPLVRVAKSLVTPNLIYFSQESFQQGHADDPDSKSWHIPIAYASKSHPLPTTDISPQLWIQAGQLLVPHAFPTDEWIVVNAQGTGYFRVLYDAHFAALLQRQLSTDIESVSGASRSQLVDDYFTAAYEGYALFQDAVQMTQFMAQELTYAAWVSFLKHFRQPYSLFAANETNFAQLREFVLPKTDRVMGAIGVEQSETEDPPTTILRVYLLDWLCGMGHEGCFSYVRDLFQAWNDDPQINPVPVDLRVILYCGAAAEGTEANWALLRTKYAERRETAFRSAFQCTTEAGRLEEVLREAEDEGVVPKAEAWAHVEVVGRSQVGRALVLSLFEARLPELVAYVGEVSELARVLSSMAPFVSSDEEIGRIAALVENNAPIFEPILPGVRASLEAMRANGVWMRTFGEKLLQALPPPPPTP